MGLKRKLRSHGLWPDKKRTPNALFPDNPIGYDDETEARAAIARVRDRTMIAYPALLSLWNQVRHCEATGVEGAFVECGVWKGGVGGFLALANLHYGSTRRPIHLFDAFDDICEPDPKVDGERALREVERFSGRATSTLSGRMQPLTGVYDHLGGPGDAEAVQHFIANELGYGLANTHIHKGWFQDTVPGADIGPIAILRLDGDWYESTKICLDHMYDAVVPGGFVIIDDYGTYEGCKKAVDEFVDSLSDKPFLGFITPDVRFWVKR